MTKASTAYPPGSAGVNFSDPREFMRLAINSGKLDNISAAGSGVTAATAGFFTQSALQGLADNTNWTANTYKTILSISSGMGLVSNLVGPTGLAGTPTTTFEITVDGAAAVEIAVAQTTTGHRSVLGPLAINGAFVIGDTLGLAPDSLDAGKSVPTYTTNIYETFAWPAIRLIGMPCLIFRTSLLIRMKSSENNSTTTNQERQSAVHYMVLA